MTTYRLDEIRAGEKYPLWAYFIADGAWADWLEHSEPTPPVVPTRVVRFVYRRVRLGYGAAWWNAHRVRAAAVHWYLALTHVA